MKFVIFAIFLTGACISAFPQDKPITREDGLGIIKRKLLKPLEVLEDSLKTYLDGIAQTQEITPICENVQKVIRDQSDVLQRYFETANDLGGDIDESQLQEIKQAISEYEKNLLDRLIENCVLSTDGLDDMIEHIHQAIQNINSGESIANTVQLINNIAEDIISFWENQRPTLYVLPIFGVFVKLATIAGAVAKIIISLV